jgi:hypothetical protein
VVLERGELPDQLLLFPRQRARHRDDDLHVVIPEDALPADDRRALAAQLEHLPRRRSLGNLEDLLAVHGLDLERGSEAGLRVAHGKRRQDLRAVSAERLVLPHAQEHVEIARRRALIPLVALAGEAELEPRAHARRNRDRELVGRPGAPRAATRRARVGDPRPTATAGRTRGPDAQEHLGLDHFADAVARRARDRFRAFLRAGAAARVAARLPRDLDFLGASVDRFQELELERVLEIGAAAQARATATPTAPPSTSEAEQVPEPIGEVAEDLVGVVEPGSIRRRAALRAEAIVGRALVRIREHAVRLGGFLELRLRGRVVRIAVRVMLGASLRYAF